MTRQPDGATRRLVLARAHTHAGQACAPGQVLDLDAATADWLLAQGVAQAIAVPPEPEPLGPADSDPKPLPRKEPKQ